MKTPPNELIDLVGGGGPASWHAVGKEFVEIATKYANLGGNSRVLDIGCGSGRIASKLEAVLTGVDAKYYGFDVSAEGIDWCNKNLANEKFTFAYFALKNSVYAPRAHSVPTSLALPIKDGDFDLALSISVFTHMLPTDIEHYMSEIARILQPGGRVLTTWFLWNHESESLINQGKSTLQFSHSLGTFRVCDSQKPEAAVSYPEETAVAMLERHRLKVRGVHPGSWCGRGAFVTYQDLVIAERI